MIYLITSLSLHAVMKKAKLCFKIAILIFVILYILPKLLNLYWDVSHPGQKIKEQQLLEKPLRVMSAIYKTC